MIYGNTEGVKNTILEKLEKLLDLKLPKGELLNSEIVDVLTEVTSDIEREISIVLDRKGNVLSVAIGDSTTVQIPSIDIKEKKLSGVRIIHTHPNGNSRLSALDISALLKLKLDCIVAIGIINGEYTNATIGFCGVYDNNLIADNMNTMNIEDLINYDFLDKVGYIESLIKLNDILEDDREKAVLVGIESEESVEELEELAKACNVEVVRKILQKRSKIDTATFIGSGKVEELALLCQAVHANVVIFDDELSGSQVRNLEENTGVKVIDRTTLILEIFARRAKSKQGKIQVELAQLKYRLSRLAGLGTVLSRTGGGIGTRGPGEKKLETDRRHIRERIYDLTRELEKIRKNRETQRERRNEVPNISLVGYTNAGKSTLRNKICDIAMPKDIGEKEKVFEADMLFATLDTTTRAVVLPDNRMVTLTDTVGFIRKLPHELVEAFKSTLEEVVNSDLLLHVVDSANEQAEAQIQAVEEVLNELGAKDKQLILVLNKVDKASEEALETIENKHKDNQILRISAKEEINLDKLLQSICEGLPNKLKEEEFIIPYSDQQMVAFLHRNSKVIEEDYKDEGTYMKALVDEEVYNKCKNYIIKN